jgi:DMSO/TMAO reductase YedYZ molybdopterin-dependent catalytic subunit
MTNPRSVDIKPRPHTALPPGQHLIDRFPRYGTHLFRPVPDLSGLRALTVTGAVESEGEIPLADLAALPRRQMVADFHCVAGWSVQGLRWEGILFRDLYESVIAKRQTQAPITHIRFVGIDGFQSVLAIDDALEDDVMVADHLDGEPLTGEHGGPVRLVCPSRYGYKSAKHLRTIELHTSEPAEGHADGTLNVGLRLVKPHPRARVAAEERHGRLPAWSVRWAYFHVLHPVFRFLCAIGDRRSAPPPDGPVDAQPEQRCRG